ncbi:hypothetical protein D3C75_1087010 [compost metagenome]
MIRDGHLLRFSLARQPVVHNLLNGAHLIDIFPVTGELYRTTMAAWALFVFLLLNPENLHMRYNPAQ